MRDRLRLKDITNRAVADSAFSPTEFRIYDRSTATICDRLICIMPFDWWVWACRNELYILNPEGGIKCAVGNTPAVQVFADQFVEVCLNLNYDSLLNGYTNLPCTIVPYEITSTVFTILTALNILVKRWIKFDSENNKLDLKFTTIDDDSSHVRRRRSRIVPPSEVVRSMSSSKYTHTQLLDKMRSIAASAATTAKPRHNSDNLLRRRGGNEKRESITAYQHTEEHDIHLPTYIRSRIVT
nr:19 kDa protein [Apis mellifera nudivirus]